MPSIRFCGIKQFTKGRILFRLSVLKFLSLCFGLSLMVACAQVQAQTQTQEKPISTVLKGYVILNEIGGQGIDNVAISADKATDTISNDNGSFSLHFNKKPGDPYKIVVSHSGWSVVNSHVLTGYLPNANTSENSNPISIIIALNEERQQWMVAYYRIKLEAVIEKSFEQKLQKRSDIGAGESYVTRLSWV